MLTTGGGDMYGVELEKYQKAYADYLYKNSKNKMTGNYLKGKKYIAGRKRLSEALCGYINAELNRFLDTEKPHEVVIQKLRKQNNMTADPCANYELTIWHKGYIKKRMIEKCEERGIIVNQES